MNWTEFIEGVSPVLQDAAMVACFFALFARVVNMLCKAFSGKENFI